MYPELIKVCSAPVLGFPPLLYTASASYWECRGSAMEDYYGSRALIGKFLPSECETHLRYLPVSTLIE